MMVSSGKWIFIGSPICLLVWLVDIVNGDDGQVAVITEVTKSNTGTWLHTKLLDLLLGDVESNWHGEEVAIGKTVILDDAVKVMSMVSVCLGSLCIPIVVLLVHETCKEKQSARCPEKNATMARSRRYVTAGVGETVPSSGEKPPLRINSKSHSCLSVRTMAGRDSASMVSCS
jgi:hypothetical protein